MAFFSSNGLEGSSKASSPRKKIPKIDWKKE